MNTIYESIEFDNKNRQVLCTLQTTEKDSFSRIHWHENLELIYVLSPTFIYLNGDEIYAERGDIIVINSNILHDFKAAPGSESTYLCIIVDIKLCDLLDIDVKNISAQNIIKDKIASNILLKIIAELKCKKKYYISNIKAYICRILVHIYRNYELQTPVNPINTKNITLVKKVINYINLNYKESITLQDISENVEYSKYYLIHTFKKMTGFTILDYINTVRIKESIKLLNGKNLNINEIALSSGFENQSYFSKVFKKYMGCTPSSYARKE